ncbi:MAG TPA: hypothetical protein VNG89_12010, partial [Vicinamibacterales bacterium]|nr:hypothetical protein [Vicinamibacterales bacterium]
PTTAGAPTTDFSIGGASNVDTEWMDAAYSDCMMWSVPLTSAQVKAQFIAASSAPIITSNLYGNWKCDSRSNFGLDASASSHNLTVLGNPIYGPLITFSDDSGSPPAAQGIMYRSSGTEAVSAASGSTVTPTFPALLNAGDAVLLVVNQKPATANGGGVTTPTGWTLIDSRTGANDGDTGGYTTTLGADTGNVNAFLYAKVISAAEGHGGGSALEGTTLTINLTNNNVAFANIYRVSNGSGLWDFVGAHGKKTAAGASVSIAMNADPGVTADDHFFAFFATPTDINVPGQKYSAHAFSQSGITFGGVAEADEYFESNGNDAGGYLVQGPIASGTSGGVPTVSSTSSGTTTNVRGPMILVRLRELPASVFVPFKLQTYSGWMPADAIPRRPASVAAITAPTPALDAPIPHGPPVNSWWPTPMSMPARVGIAAILAASVTVAQVPANARPLPPDWSAPAALSQSRPLGAILGTPLLPPPIGTSARITPAWPDGGAWRPTASPQIAPLISAPVAALVPPARAPAIVFPDQWALPMEEPFGFIALVPTPPNPPPPALQMPAWPDVVIRQPTRPGIAALLPPPDNPPLNSRAPAALGLWVDAAPRAPTRSAIAAVAQDFPPPLAQRLSAQWLDGPAVVQARPGIAALLPVVAAPPPPQRAQQIAAVDAWTPPVAGSKIGAFFSGPIPSPLPPPTRAQPTWPETTWVVPPHSPMGALINPPPAPDNPPPLRRQQLSGAADIQIQQLPPK